MKAATVPPGRQRTSDIAPQHPPSRPREEAISLAQHKVSLPSQAAREPGAAMVLARIGCHRAPFGSFPRVGKNASPARATDNTPPRPARWKDRPAHPPACKRAVLPAGRKAFMPVPQGKSPSRRLRHTPASGECAKTALLPIERLLCSISAKIRRHSLAQRHGSCYNRK